MSLRREMLSAWFTELQDRFKMHTYARSVDATQPRSARKTQISIYPTAEATIDEPTNRRISNITFQVVVRTWFDTNESPLDPFIKLCERVETAIYEKWDERRAIVRTDDNCFRGLTRTEMEFNLVKITEYDECILTFEYGIDYPRKLAHV